MRARTSHRLTAMVVVALGAGTLHAAPSNVALTGIAVSADTILWTWAPGTDPATVFTLLGPGPVTIRTLPGPSNVSFTEGPLALATAFQRQLQQTDSGGTTISALVSVATPDASVPVPLGSPATLVGSDNLTRALIPSGALPGPGQVSVSADPINKPLTSLSTALIAAATAKLPSGRIAVTASFREFITFASVSPFTGAFASPASIQIPYLDVNNTGIVDGVTPVAHVETLALFTIDPALRQWVPVPGATLDRTNKVFAASVSHFSVYGLFGAVASGDLGALKAFPNPWRPGTGGAFDDARGIHFQGLTATASIKIFTMTGDIVRRLDKSVDDGNEKIWDGRNDSGEKVASGIYFYLVTNPDSQQQKTGRIGIIR